MIHLNNIDCLRYTPWFTDNYFDLVDADPPYFSGPEKRKYYGASRSTAFKVKRIDYPVTDSWNLPDKDWWEEVKRVSKNQIVWGANYFDFLGEPFKTPRGNEIEEFINNHPKGWIIWDKCNGRSSFNDYELAWTSFNTPTVIYKFMWNGMNQGRSMDEGHVMQGDKKLNQKRIHPTEKPVFLYDWQFKHFTSPGDKVLSTHGGSFSDALSAMKFDIEFHGCEIDKIHFSKGLKRFLSHQSQLKLLI